MTKIRLSAFADEHSEMLVDQLKALNELSIPYIELRGVDGANVSTLTEEKAKEVKATLDRYNVKVWSIGSPLGKVKIDAPFEEHLKLVEHVLKIANILDCDKIRMFSFFTEDYENVKDEVVSRLNKMCAMAKEYGVTLYHENEKGIFGDTAERCKYLLDNVDGLKCVYDPANFVQCDVSVDEAMDILDGRIGYYHIKDAYYGTGAIVPAGLGHGKIEELLDRISLDETVLTLEPHLSLFTGYNQIDDTKLVNVITYSSCQEAFTGAVDHLKGILKKLGYKEIDKVWTK